MSDNDKLHELDARHLWHPFTQAQTAPPPILITRRKGTWLTASDGKNYLDLVSSWWVNLHGHAHPAIARAIAEQAAKLEHVVFAGFTHEPAIELARRILQHYAAIAHARLLFRQWIYRRRSCAQDGVSVLEQQGRDQSAIASSRSMAATTATRLARCRPAAARASIVRFKSCCLMSTSSRSRRLGMAMKKWKCVKKRRLPRSIARSKARKDLPPLSLSR